jgi:hypothetical protein
LPAQSLRDEFEIRPLMPQNSTSPGEFVSTNVLSKLIFSGGHWGRTSKCVNRFFAIFISNGAIGSRSPKSSPKHRRETGWGAHAPSRVAVGALAGRFFLLLHILYLV